ncbi:MAG: group III truncated hemoglobin [Pedobacter sp.]
MKKDIETSKDIALLVETFYTEIMQDELLGPVFLQHNFNLEGHLPVMISFWEGILFDIHTYKGNPVRVHQEMNAFSPLLPLHFKRWLTIWSATANKLFAGARTEEVVARAKTIASILEAKLIA